ncbi:aminoglycoside phosphotransferase family protein [Acidaminobacter sp. JC074]|uniref:aminoglycoside phosphotransferase family protein n=1 Tax=Acidaminobacter sp. JC074 TaxID=2530199 RepID=UPI001F1073ED|nr:aminoglycoside phosphotransferase family protein [Acidaminobacter sp. JC074]MCH4890074.1 aminoglycoside phosphotransferase family protein [Acidaminobacter sp. JC074]
MERIKKIIEDVLLVEAIGHVHLKRHEVYKVTTKRDTYIIKFYGVDNRFQNELAALELLEGMDLPTPKIIKHGEMDGSEYVVMSLLEGCPLDKLELSDTEKNHIYYEAGLYLKKIHGVKHDLSFGRIGSKKFDLFDQHFQYELERILMYLKRDNHPFPDIIEKGIETIKKQTFSSEDKTLCHMDYCDRNILIKNGKISGIIDFEQSIISDRNWDLAYTLSKVEEKYQSAFFKGYGSKPDKIDFFMLYRGLHTCSWALAYVKDFYMEGLNLVRRFYE